MKGLVSFVKTTFAKVPAVKLNGMRDDQNQYDERNSSTGFMGNLDISDGVLAFTGTMSRENIVDDVLEESSEIVKRKSIVAVEEKVDSYIPTDTMNQTRVYDEDLHNLVTIEKSYAFQANYNIKEANEISVGGVFSNTIVNTSQDIIFKIDGIKETFGLNNPADELVLSMEMETNTGKAYTFKQFFKNIEVVGYNVKAAMDFDAIELSIETCLIQSDVLERNILSITPKLSEKETSDWIHTLYPDVTKIISSLIIYPDKYGANPKLAYLSYLYNQNDRSRRQQIVTDANTGEIIYEDDMCF